MGLKLFKAKLCTSGRTKEQIKKDYGGDITEKEIIDWQHALDLIDNKEVIVAEAWKGRYTLISWFKKDDSAFIEFVYQAEQDQMFGTYIDDREQFLKDWKNEVY